MQRPIIATELALAILILMLSGCIGSEGRQPSEESRQDPIVAKIGDLSITEREFFISYEMAPSFLKRMNSEGEARFHHLQYMILEKIMAADGLSKRIDTREDLSIIISEIHGDLAVTAWYDSIFGKSVVVSKAEVERAVEAYSIQLDYEYVFVDSEEQAQQVQYALQDGHSFHYLGQLGFNPGRAKEIRLWDLLEKDPEFAQALTDLEINTVSGIIPLDNGFAFAKINSLKREDPLSITASSEQARRLEKQILQTKKDSIAFDYVASEMEEAAAVIKAPQFDQLLTFFEALKYQDTRDASQMVSGRWPGSLDRDGIEGQVADTLVTSRNVVVTVDKFLDWYDLRRFEVAGVTRPQRAGRLKSIIWRMFRDRLLIQKAKDSGFMDQAAVKEELAWWKEKLVYWESREALVAELVPTEKDIEAYIEREPHRFSGLTDEERKEKAFKELYTIMERRKLNEYFEGKRSQYPIQVDSQAVKNINLTNFGTPKAIELIAFKKEGTFPRIAYPTIDRVWERYPLQ